MQDTGAWLTPETLAEATRHFDRAAQAVAHDPELALRIERERLPLDLVWLTRYYALRSHAKRQGVEFLGPADPLAACRKRIEQSRRFGNRFYGEGRAFDDYAKGLLGRFRAPAPPPEFCRGLAEDDWIDVQDNRFQLHQPGTASSLVDDPNASDQASARMPANHVQWAVQYHLGDDRASRSCRLTAICQVRGIPATICTTAIRRVKASGEAVRLVNDLCPCELTPILAFIQGARATVPLASLRRFSTPNESITLEFAPPRRTPSWSTSASSEGSTHGKGSKGIPSGTALQGATASAILVGTTRR